MRGLSNRNLTTKLRLAYRSCGLSKEAARFFILATNSGSPESPRFNAENLPVVALLEARKIVQGVAERRLYRFKIPESWLKH
jgi:hypothetical protein